MEKKTIGVKQQQDEEEVEEWKEFSEDLTSLLSIEELSEGLVRKIVKEAKKLLNIPNAIRMMPSLRAKDRPVKYLVAAKNCKRGMYEYAVHHDHVTCTCPCYKHNRLCKHSLCVAESRSMSKSHIDYFVKSPWRSRPSKSGLMEPDKHAAGKKGSCHKNPWRPNRGKSSDAGPRSTPADPYNCIHHNDRPFPVQSPKRKSVGSAAQNSLEEQGSYHKTLCCHTRRDGCTPIPISWEVNFPRPSSPGIINAWSGTASGTASRTSTVFIRDPGER